MIESGQNLEESRHADVWEIDFWKQLALGSDFGWLANDDGILRSVRG